VLFPHFTEFSPYLPRQNGDPGVGLPIVSWHLNVENNFGQSVSHFRAQGLERLYKSDPWLLDGHSLINYVAPAWHANRRWLSIKHQTNVEFGSGAYFYFIHLCGNGDASSRNMFAILFAIFNVCFATLLLVFLCF